MDPHDQEAPEHTPTQPGLGATIAPGTVIQHTYQILSLLSQGGMGEVYKARHQISNTLHAIKIIRPDLVNEPQSLALFKREANVIRGIHHDSVVNYDGLLCDEDGRVYIIMEFIEGPTLRQFLRLHGKLTVSELLTLANRLAEGIAAFHNKGVVHRDLSPENIIIPDKCLEKAMVIDFGIAKQIGPDAKTLLGKHFAGKIAYAAPERLEMHEPDEIDGRSDLYSLGMVLLTAANGKQASRSNAEEILATFPSTLSGLVSWMLERNPINRPQSANEIIDRIQTEIVGNENPSAKKFILAGTFLVLIGVFGYLAFDSGFFRTTDLVSWMKQEEPSNKENETNSSIEPDPHAEVSKNDSPNELEKITKDFQSDNERNSEIEDPELENAATDNPRIEEPEVTDTDTSKATIGPKEESTESIPSDNVTTKFDFQKPIENNQKPLTPNTRPRTVDKTKLPLVNMMPTEN